MNTHDVLAFAVAQEAVQRIRRAEPPWNDVFSTQVHATSSRSWPMPDFVIQDSGQKSTAGAEFKPPNQSKREYLTGLGQALAYTKNFTFGLLVVPNLAIDGYPIADHIQGVLSERALQEIPVGLLRYDARLQHGEPVTFDVLRALQIRTHPPSSLAPVEESFYAKWREMSPEEIERYLHYLYEEGRKCESSSVTGSTVRDAAFDRFWADVQGGTLKNWSGGTRHISNRKVAWRKNYTNFLHHVGWIEPDGRLTEDGLRCVQLLHRYRADSRVFVDKLAVTLLTAGKHLVLINAINDFQTSHFQQMGEFADEQGWLNAVETFLEER